jgi:hypothetical protein
MRIAIEGLIAARPLSTLDKVVRSTPMADTNPYKGRNAGS